MMMSFLSAASSTVSPRLTSTTAPSGQSSAWGKNMICGMLSLFYKYLCGHTCTAYKFLNGKAIYRGETPLLRILNLVNTHARQGGMNRFIHTAVGKSLSGMINGFYLRFYGIFVIAITGNNKRFDNADDRLLLLLV